MFWGTPGGAQASTSLEAALIVLVTEFLVLLSFLETRMWEKKKKTNFTQSLVG